MPKIYKSGPGIGFLDNRYVNVTGDTMTGQLILSLAGVGLSVTQDAVMGGYLRVGSTSAPTNTTAGDITGVRLKIGDGAFGTGVDFSVTGDGALSGFLRVGSETAPSNTTAGDITGVRLNLGNVTSFGTGGRTIRADFTATATAAGADSMAQFVHTINPASNSSAEFRAIYFQNIVTAATGITISTLRAGFFENRQRQDGAITASIGVVGQAATIDSSSAATVGTITTAEAFDARIYGRPSGSSTLTITTGVGYDTPTLIGATGLTATDIIGFRMVAVTNGTITNLYGVNIASLNRGTAINEGIRVAQPGLLNGQANSTDSIAINIPTASVTFGNTTGTTDDVHGIYVGIITYTSTTNTRTMTRLSSIYVAGAPVASTNVTGTPYALWVDADTSRFDGRVLQNQGADVASANNLVLGSDGNTFEITGTTQINLISNVGWQNGSEINLVFTSTPTVKDAQATSGTNITIILAGSTDFVASADDILTLVLCEVGGTQAWREKCRSAN